MSGVLSDSDGRGVVRDRSPVSKPIFQKDVAFMPFQQVDRPNGKDIIKDYTSEDGNTKYHAEFHYNTGKMMLLEEFVINCYETICIYENIGLLRPY